MSLNTAFLFGGTETSSWLESVKSQPAVLSYSLEPLHTLVNEADPRRESLRQALSQSVRERALWRNCSLPCPPGTHHSPWTPARASAPIRGS